jgi:hypothetical protein
MESPEKLLLRFDRHVERSSIYLQLAYASSKCSAHFMPPVGG